jgi:endonuclease/exonuclease/phosphatase family metal-dependent hydrolase
VHLKASKGSKNKDQRLTGAKAILEDVSTLPKGCNVILVGDMNFYSHTEPAYQALITVLIDPLGKGAWDGDAEASKHTQSPRSVRKGGLVHGGLDDRFDFQFISASLQDGRGMDIIRGSYHAFGNDGHHFNVAINENGSKYYRGNKTRSTILVEALHEASDHIPVMADYKIIKKKVKKPTLDNVEE